MSTTHSLFTPFATQVETITIGPEQVAAAGLEAWAAQFKLGTAGYRDLLDPEDLFNTAVPFNALTVALVLEARAQLSRAAGLASLHVGGEVRPHTQELIDLAARLYAAHGFAVHLRPSGNAPEFRCYNEAATVDRAGELNTACMKILASMKS